MRERIVELDAVRGVAVIGIAWMNVYVFALPLQAYYNPAAYGAQGPLDYAVWAASFVLVEDKFRTLFAMLFGVGIAIMWEGGSGWRDHLARMAVLLLIGLAHATLLASNDILRVYALAGSVLPLFLRLPWRLLALAASAALALHLVGGYLWLSHRPAAFFALNFGARPDGLEAALDLGREAIGERIVRRLAALPASLATVSAAIPINFATMLAGVALWRSGLVPSAWSRGRAAALPLVGVFVALPALVLIAWSTSSLDFDPRAVARNALVVSAPFDLLLGFAYATALLALFARFPRSPAVTLLAAVGRMALTNYIMTGVVFGALFATWGLGLFAEFSRSQALGVSLLPALLMLAWSPAWLARFGRGPAESGWRKLSSRLAGSRR